MLAGQPTEIRLACSQHTANGFERQPVATNKVTDLGQKARPFALLQPQTFSGVPVRSLGLVTPNKVTLARIL
jgi:hypothetical protein